MYIFLVAIPQGRSSFQPFNNLVGRTISSARIENIEEFSQLANKNAGAAATASGVKLILKARRFLIDHSMYDLTWAKRNLIMTSMPFDQLNVAICGGLIWSPRRGCTRPDRRVLNALPPGTAAPFVKGEGETRHGSARHSKMHGGIGKSARPQTLQPRTLRHFYRLVDGWSLCDEHWNGLLDFN